MGYFFWRIGDFFKNLFIGLFKSIIDIIVGAIETIRYILYKVLMLLLVFTNIGFVIGIVMLVMNVVEAINGTIFTQTKHFKTMIILMLAHFILFNICKVVRPKDI